jgi:hypothetical protein
MKWLMVCLSVIASSSSGFIERIAYRSIVENYFEHGKLFLSVYLSLSTVSHVWISVLYSFLLEKFGLAPTFLIGGALVFVTIPLLSFLTVKELFGEKSQKVTPKLKVSLEQILKKFLTDVKFISYIVVLLVVCSTRSMLVSQGSYILEKVLKMSPTKASLISDGLGSVIPFFTRLFFGSMLRNSYVMELTTSILSIHMGGLLMMILTENRLVFSLAMVLLQSSVGLVHPLGHSFKNSLDPVDRKAFNQLQTMVTMLGSCMPIWADWMNEKLKVLPKNHHKSTLGIYLLINILATWCILLA